MAELLMSTGGVILESSAVSTSKGVALANTSANTKTTYTTLIASTASACNMLMVQLEIDAGSATNSMAGLFDIAVGAAASETVILPDLLCPATGYTPTFNSGVAVYVLPVSIPAGIRLSARCSLQTTGARAYVSIHPMGGGVGLGHGPGTVEAWGVTTATSEGIKLDPGGTANTKGSYTQLIASTARPTKEIHVVLYSPDADSAGNDQVRKWWTVDVAIGAAASEKIIIPDILATRAWTVNFLPGNPIRFPFSIPASTRVSARAQCTSIAATPYRSVGIIIYGIG